jgi:hypothetical protein
MPMMLGEPPPAAIVSGDDGVRGGGGGSGGGGGDAARFPFSWKKLLLPVSFRGDFCADSLCACVARSLTDAISRARFPKRASQSDLMFRSSSYKRWTKEATLLSVARF